MSDPFSIQNTLNSSARNKTNLSELSVLVTAERKTHAFMEKRVCYVKKIAQILNYLKENPGPIVVDF